MAASKSRLGRGLGGLIAAASKADASAHHASPSGPPAAPVAAPGFQEIAVDLIEPSPYQARRGIPSEQLSALADSIRSEGLLQPVVVLRPRLKFQLTSWEPPCLRHRS